MIKVCKCRYPKSRRSCVYNQEKNQKKN